MYKKCISCIQIDTDYLVNKTSSKKYRHIYRLFYKHRVFTKSTLYTCTKTVRGSEPPLSRGKVHITRPLKSACTLDSLCSIKKASVPKIFLAIYMFQHVCYWLLF